MAMGTLKPVAGAAPTKLRAARPKVKILENISKLEKFGSLSAEELRICFI
jgi:hypothetical protein